MSINFDLLVRRDVQQVLARKLARALQPGRMG